MWLGALLDDAADEARTGAENCTDDVSKLVLEASAVLLRLAGRALGTLAAAEATEGSSRSTGHCCTTPPGCLPARNFLRAAMPAGVGGSQRLASFFRAVLAREPQELQYSICLYI